jgi:hypothetical protein
MVILTLVVMGQMVLLHLCHVLRQLGVVQRIVHAVVKDVKGKGSCNDSVGDRLGEEQVS